MKNYVTLLDYYLVLLEFSLNGTEIQLIQEIW